MNNNLKAGLITAGIFLLFVLICIKPIILMYVILGVIFYLMLAIIFNAIKNLL